MTTADLRAQTYPVAIRPDTLTDGAFCYIAEHPDLPGCSAHGYTLSEAQANLAHAREAYLRHLRATGRPVPPPSTDLPNEVTWEASIIEVPAAAA